MLLCKARKPQPSESTRASLRPIISSDFMKRPLDNDIFFTNYFQIDLIDMGHRLYGFFKWIAPYMDHCMSKISCTVSVSVKISSCCTIKPSVCCLGYPKGLAF